MKKILTFCMLLLLQLAAHAQGTKYTVTLNVPENGTLTAYAYGFDDWESRTEFTAGEEVHLTGSLRSEYSFISWTDESGTVMCDSLFYTFTMPARNITLTAHTEYDPVNPPGPHEDGYTATWNHLYLRSNPTYGGAFTWGLNAENAQNWLVPTDYEFTVQAYPATGFKFIGWQLDGEIVSNDNPYTFIFPERDMTLYAMYEYDPDTPANPDANKWNKESGELIITDFKPGSLYSTVTEVTRRDPWSSDWNLVKSAIIAGRCANEAIEWDNPIDSRAITYICNNLEFLDYSRTSGITAFPEACFCVTTLKHVILPATTLSIGYQAFRDCEALTTVTCFATTPPAFEGSMTGEPNYNPDSYDNWAFEELIFDNIIIHVPAEAVPLYQEARGWKEFMILPITQGVQKLTVSLPQAASYKNMFLELVNNKTLQSQRYVITSATSYTFNNLIRDTQHTLYLKNQRGDILGTVASIDIVDEDVQVSFPDLKTPIDIALRLTLPDGSLAGADDFTATWTDRQGNYLGQGATLPGQISGTQVLCRIRLEEALGRQYLAPADTLFSVSQDAALSLPLSPIPQRQLHGTVTAESTSQPIRGATITVSQQLNGLYPVTQTAKSASDGTWSLTVYDAQTIITASHSDYLKTSVCPTVFPSEAPLNIALRDITGTIVNLDLYYQTAIHDGEESTSQDYDDYANISYSIYDETHQTAVTDLSIQYPMIVLVDQQLEQGTRLSITATSIDNKFMPVKATCSVDSTGHAIATLPIVQLGKIEASFEMTDNERVVALLFNEEGKLLGWEPYRGVSLTLNDIPDGRYHFITMGSSMLSTSFNTLYALNNIGLKEEVDYIDNRISVTSGHITEVKNPFIPAFDETGFLYTGDQTSFSVNKQEVAVGQYVTLKAQVDFKTAYAADNVQLIFDLPEGCALVDGSVMVGNHTANYTIDGYRIIVDVPDVNDVVRLCVVPTASGTHQVTANVSADLNGTNTRQPIGQAVFAAEELTINVPETIGRRLLPVSGMAVPLSQIEIFDGDVSIGQTTSIGTGYFSTMCPLDNPYNLSNHYIHAVITTPEGIQMQSETKTVKVNRGSLTPVVTMQVVGTDWEHHKRNFVFDFRTNEVSSPGMKLTDFGNFYINFRIDFYDQNDLLVNDTTVIRDVTLYTLFESRDVASYPLQYNERHKCWFLTFDNQMTNMPVNVDVDYTMQVDAAFDRQELEDRMTALMDYFEEGRNHMLEVHHIFDDDDAPLDEQPIIDELWALLDNEASEAATTQHFLELIRTLVGDSIMDAAAQEYTLDLGEIEPLLDSEYLSEEEEARLDSLLDNRANLLETIFSTDLPDPTLLQQQLDELSRKYDEMAAEARDSLLYINALLFYPDTTAIQMPNGDMSVIIPGQEGRYQKFDINMLTTIDREQLLADGFMEIPTVDGTPFYVLLTEDTYCLVDAKNMKRYSRQLVTEQEVPQARKAGEWWAALLGLSPSILFPKYCGDEFDNLQRHLTKGIVQMKQAQGFIPKLEAFTTNVLPVLTDAVDIFCCVYDNGRAALEKHFNDYYKKVGDKAKTELGRAQAAVEGIQKSISNLGNKISELRKNISLYEKHNSILRNRLNRGNISNKLRVEWTNKINSNLARINDWQNKLSKASDVLKNLKEQTKTAFKSMNKAQKAFDKVLKNQKFVTDILKKFPMKLIPDEKIVAKLPKAYFAIPIAGWFLKCFPVACIIVDNVFDANEWLRVNAAIHAVLPCYGNEAEAQQLVSDCEQQFMWHMVINFGQIGIDVASLFIEAGSFLDARWWTAKILDVVSCVIAIAHPDASTNDRKRLEARLDALKCKPKPDEEPQTSGADDDWIPSGGTLIEAKLRYDHPNWRHKNLWFIRDPAGYVYEAVNSNRIEGVQTTCYYKEEVEDMYGDIHEKVVLWDAENYAQENPLFTDADGRYQWDVPTGLWQVKYEKQGYETTYSDWLPVPPPQLEVNVGITQMQQPNVKKVRAYATIEGSTIPSGVEIMFDKYMNPETLTADNIFVASGGQAMNGKIVLLDAEDGYQKPGVMYASKIRFEPAQPLTLSDKVQLTVRNRVESYAGIPMEQNFTQQFDVEMRIEQLLADSLMNMQEDKQQTLLVKALPAQAAKGKKIIVTNTDDNIISSNASELTLDDNGEAQLTVTALAQGSGVIRFTLADDEKLTTATLITVRDSSQMQVATPRASRLNGITLYAGSEIRLTCATNGATILYTLDGSCPCDAPGDKVMTYTGPILLTGDSIVIRAMAIAPGMDDSDVAEFHYKSKERPVGIEEPIVENADENGEHEPSFFYRLSGQRISQPERGINIVRQKNRRVRKVVVK